VISAGIQYITIKKLYSAYSHSVSRKSAKTRARELITCRIVCFEILSIMRQVRVYRVSEICKTIVPNSWTRHTD